MLFEDMTFNEDSPFFHLSCFVLFFCLFVVFCCCCCCCFLLLLLFFVFWFCFFFFWFVCFVCGFFFFCAIRQHSVEVDTEASETVCAFYDIPNERDCWHCLCCCFVVEVAAQGLRLAWIDFGLCLLAPMWHLFQLLLDSGDHCVDATGCIVDKPVVQA